MSVPLWAASLAADFWARAGELEAFPRDLSRPVARAVPLSIALLPRLGVRAALQWLQKCGLVCEFPGEDRPLRACLIARRGHGIAIVDGSDGDAERRFSIAHELAHFLRDYWSLRRRISKRLGPAALEVVDGERLASPEERVHALLCEVSLGFHLHLMERDNAGDPATALIADAEASADRLAYELLAPACHVLANPAPKNRQIVANKLRHIYGLPSAQASRYARILLPTAYTDPLLARLKSMA